MGTTEYQLIIVREDFASPNASNFSIPLPVPQYSTNPDVPNAPNGFDTTYNYTMGNATLKNAISGKLTPKNVTECLAAYNSKYQSAFGDVVAVSSDSSMNHTEGTAFAPTGLIPNGWLCGNFSPEAASAPCLNDIANLSTHWILNNHIIDHVS